MNEGQNICEDKKHNRFEQKEIRAIGLAVLFLIISLIIVLIINKLVGFVGDAVYISFMVIPIFVYLAFSGIIEEFKAPGGWEVKFAKAASQNVAYQETIDVQKVLGVVKGSAKEIKDRLYHLKYELLPSQPIALTYQLGIGTNFYNVQDSLLYVRSLSQFRNFNLVIFLDRMERYEANISPRAIADLLNDPESAYEFIKVINEGNLFDLFNYPGIVTNSISNQCSNADALRTMDRLNVDELVVVDESRHVKGLVKRNILLSKLTLEALAK